MSSRPSSSNHNSIFSKHIFSFAHLLDSISRLNNCCRANGAAVHNGNQNLKEMEVKS